MEQHYYRKILSEELERRIEKNPAYSLRAFAKSLEVDVGTLSRTLSSKQDLALATAKKVSTKLELGEYDRELFLRSVMDATRDRRLGARGR